MKTLRELLLHILASGQPETLDAVISGTFVAAGVAHDRMLILAVENDAETPIGVVEASQVLAHAQAILLDAVCGPVYTEPPPAGPETPDLGSNVVMFRKP